MSRRRPSTLPSAVSAPSPSISVDLVLVPEHLHAAGERLRDLRRAARRAPSSRCSTPSRLDPELGAVHGLVVELGAVEHGLRGDAGVVEAAPAGLVLLDDGGLHARAGRRGSRRHSRPGRRRSRSRHRNRPSLDSYRSGPPSRRAGALGHLDPGHRLDHEVEERARDRDQRREVADIWQRSSAPISARPQAHQDDRRRAPGSRAPPSSATRHIPSPSRP